MPTGASTARPASTAGITGDGDAGIFAHFIARHYFTLIALNFADTTALDHRIADQLHHDPHYRTIDVIPYTAPDLPASHGTYVIWRYEAHR